MSYRVAYWMGGAAAGEWRVSLPMPSINQALTTCRDIVRGGRAACVLGDSSPIPTDPPEWWDFTLLQDKTSLPSMMRRIGRLPETIDGEVEIIN